MDSAEMEGHRENLVFCRQSRTTSRRRLQ